MEKIYVSTYDEVCKVISKYETDTISKFIIRRVDKEFGSKGTRPPVRKKKKSNATYKKLDCPAVIQVKHIVKFRDFKAAGLREGMDSRIAKKIRQLTMQGVRKRGEMKRHLDNFVRNEMFKDQKPPPTYRRRFYPRRKDLDYHISKAKLANRLATLDQDNVEAHIEQWKNRPRPCSTSGNARWYKEKTRRKVYG
ncbi:hypothetical protein OS493_027254 [Desmophyllum pertusum]|uniref:Uncharacterized protein n=1 Tax=Desmophyllum pertusum TaxID=174260 RepID=A0A9W9Z9W1_9CNID|nr:hypothetical protein OS493_027254 [Desmophyllum pertusum]